MLRRAQQVSGLEWYQFRPATWLVLCQRLIWGWGPRALPVPGVIRLVIALAELVAPHFCALAKSSRFLSRLQVSLSRIPGQGPESLRVAGEQPLRLVEQELEGELANLAVQ